MKTKCNESIKPPDLWIHHDQMELKAMEKTGMIVPSSLMSGHHSKRLSSGTELEPDDKIDISHSTLKRNPYVGEYPRSLTEMDG